MNQLDLGDIFGGTVPLSDTSRILTSYLKVKYTFCTPVWLYQLNSHQFHTNNRLSRLHELSPMKIQVSRSKIRDSNYFFLEKKSIQGQKSINK